MADLLADQEEIQNVLSRDYNVYGTVNEEELDAGACWACSYCRTRQLAATGIPQWA